MHADVPFAISDYIVEPDETVDANSLQAIANEWWKRAYWMQQTKSPIRALTGF